MWSTGTLGPTLSSKYLFTLLPGFVPFLVRPVCRAICSAVIQRRIDPDLRVAAEIVRLSGLSLTRWDSCTVAPG